MVTPIQDQETKAQAIVHRQARLESDRQTITTLWSRLADYGFPFHNINRTSSPTTSFAERIYDSTLMQANFVCASGVTTNTTPATDRWFALEAPSQLRSRIGGGSEADLWFQECTEILHRELAASNFYSEILPFNAERSFYGTGNLFTEEGEESLFQFRAIPISSYDIAWSAQGRVDTVYRKWTMSARAAAQQFKPERLTPELRKAWEAENGRHKDREFTFIHAVYPRSDSERDPYRRDGANKRFASCYVCVEDKALVRESGYDEFPYAVSRWDVWPGQIWGWSPGLMEIGVIRQLNQHEKMLDLLLEKKIDPRVLVPQSMWGTVDFKAGGITPFDENNPNAKPQEWMTVGDAREGKERGDLKREEIRRAFHNDLFQMFGQLEQRITAYEAAQRAGEKLDVFIPVFQRLTTECLNPTLLRCFGIAFRAGYFPEPPADVFTQTRNGEPTIAIPKVAYQSRMALAIRALENRSFDTFMQRMAVLAQADPTVMDWLNQDEAVPALARNDMVPSKWIKRQKDVVALRQARAEQQQAAQTAALAESATKSAANLGTAPQWLQSAAANALDAGS